MLKALLLECPCCHRQGLLFSFLYQRLTGMRKTLILTFFSANPEWAILKFDPSWQRITL
jgi:hypothetical protein